MKYLLDTHVFLWWILEDDRLGSEASALIENPDNDILISSVCGWEISIKAGLGRLDLPQNPAAFVTTQISANNFDTLSIAMHHALGVYDLPDHHRDLFDRILIAQSRAEKIPIISSDAAFRDYDVDLVVS